MPRDSKGVKCYTRVGGKSGKPFTTCIDKTNAQLIQDKKTGQKASPHQGKYLTEPAPGKKPSVTQPEKLEKFSVNDLRKMARGRGMRGEEVSKMRKAELVKMLSKQPKRKTGGSKTQSPDRQYVSTRRGRGDKK